jgi:hypothetical protein
MLFSFSGRESSSLLHDANNAIVNSMYVIIFVLITQFLFLLIVLFDVAIAAQSYIEILVIKNAYL